MTRRRFSAITSSKWRTKLSGSSATPSTDRSSYRTILRMTLLLGISCPSSPLPRTAGGELEQAVADHRDPRTGFALVVPGLPAAHQRLAVFGPGEVPPAQDLPEHCVDRVWVAGGKALQRQRRDGLR